MLGRLEGLCFTIRALENLGWAGSPKSEAERGGKGRGTHEVVVGGKGAVRGRGLVGSLISLLDMIEADGLDSQPPPPLLDATTGVAETDPT